MYRIYTSKYAKPSYSTPPRSSLNLPSQARTSRTGPHVSAAGVHRWLSYIDWDRIALPLGLGLAGSCVYFYFFGDDGARTVGRRRWRGGYVIVFGGVSGDVGCCAGQVVCAWRDSYLPFPIDSLDRYENGGWMVRGGFVGFLSWKVGMERDLVTCRCCWGKGRW